MKKLFALALVALVVVSAPVSIAIQFPRQVDPSTAPADQVYGQGLYVFYGSIVAALIGGNYTAARALLSQASFIHIPAVILDTVNRFNGLLNSATGKFVVIDSQLVNASYYISTGRLDLARANLTDAVSNLRSANQTLTQLFSAEPQLAALTGIPSSLLLEKLQPLEKTYVGYSAQANRLLTVLTGLTKLEGTAVTLALGQRSIEVGSNITVSGTLAGAAGAPLPSREVTIFFQNQAIGVATTDASGSYSAQLATPYFYQRNATMFASFLPGGNDSLVYAPATSRQVEVAVDFAVPSISLVAPSLAYAGQPMGVNGTLSLAGKPLAGYDVTLSGFRASPLAANELSMTTTAADGSFSASLTPSAGLVGGEYTLVLGTSSAGAVGPLSVSLRVTLVKETPTVTSSAPGFAIAGLPVTVSGTVESNGTGIAGAHLLSTAPTPAVDARTSSSGSFSFTVIPPLTTGNGAWSYTVEVYPSQSWIAPAPVKVDVYIINPLVLLFPASSFGLLALVVSRRRRTPAGAQVASPLMPTEARAAAGSAPMRPGGIPGMYFQAVELVERATSVAHLPQMTVREYLAAVQGKLKGFEHFRSLSYALEAHLYSGGAVAVDETKAGAELTALRGELEG